MPTLKAAAIKLVASLPADDPLRRELLGLIKQAHHVGYGEKALELSWQADFPKTVPCVKCGKPARHALTLMEDQPAKSFATQLHANDPKGEGFWLHDAAAFAIYLCTDIRCTTATTEWNQG